MKLAVKDIAAALDIYMSSAAELLNGIIRIKDSEVQKIAEYFNVTSEEIMHSNCNMRLKLKVK